MKLIVLITLSFFLILFTGPLFVIIFLMFCALDMQFGAGQVTDGIKEPLIAPKNVMICIFCLKNIVAELEIKDGGVRGRTCNYCKKFNKI